MQRWIVWVGFSWLLFVSSEGWCQDIRYADFSDTSALVFSGHTGEIAKKRGRKKSLRLTDQLGQHGGAFFHRRIRLTQEASFRTSFSFRIHSPQGWTDTDGVQGADGIVFVIQTTSDQVGQQGAGIGYEGLHPSLGIEFDTWQNDYDPDGNHVGLNIDGSMRSLQTVKIPVAMNNGAIWYAWVDYHGPSKSLEVRLSQTPQRPATPILQRVIDLASLFQRPDVFVGFTSATGMAGGRHDLLTWAFWSHYAPLETTGQILVTETVAHQVTPDQIGIILDASGSMRLKTPSKERRIDLAKRVLREIVPSFPPGSHIGLLAYGHRYPPSPAKRSCRDIEMLLPFGPLDPEGFLRTLSAIKPRGETPIGRAIAQIGAAFRPSSKPKWIVVLSDGIETCDPRPSDPFYPLRVINDLEKKGIRVRVNLVGLAISKSKTHRFLHQIAQSSGGSYWKVQSAGQLKQAFEAAMTVRFSLHPVSPSASSSQEAPRSGKRVSWRALPSTPPARGGSPLDPQTLGSASQKRKNLANHPIFGSIGSSPVSLPPGAYILEVALPSGILRRRVQIRAGHTTHLLLDTAPTGFVLVEKAEGKAQANAGKGTKAEGKTQANAGKGTKAEGKTQANAGEAQTSEGKMLPSASSLSNEEVGKRPSLPASATVGKRPSLRASAIVGKRPSLPASTILPLSACFPDAAALSTEGLFRQMAASFSFQLYEGILRGDHGTCIARAGSSLEMAALLASLLRSKGEEIRIAQATLSPAEGDAVFRIFLQREAKRLSQNQASEATEEAAFQAMLQGLPELTAFEVVGLLPPHQEIVRSLDRVRDILLSRPEEITVSLLQQIRKVWPQTQEEIRSRMKKRAEVLRSRLLRHTWVQVKRSGVWLDLDPALALPFGQAFRKPDRLSSLEEILQTTPRHRISFEIDATFQAGSERKERSVLHFDTDAASLTGHTIGLTFAPTQAFEEARLAGAINQLLGAKDAGLPYRPVLSVGTRVIEGHALTIQDWRPKKKADPFGLSALSGESSPPSPPTSVSSASSSPEIVSIALTIRYTSPQGRLESHRRLLFDRSTPAPLSPPKALPKTSPESLKPLSPALLQTLRSLRAYRVVTGAWPISLASNPPFPSAHPVFQPPSSLVSALHSYLQRQHSEVFGGRSFGYLDSPSIIGVEIHGAFLEGKEAEDSATSSLSFDIVRQGWLALRYDDPARVGLLTAAVEHTFGELLRLSFAGAFRPPASLVSIFQAAEASKIPLRLIRQASELSALALPPHIQAKLLPFLRHSWLLLPERLVPFQGRERLAWLRIDPQTGEVSDQADDLAGSTFVEFLQKMWQDLRTAKGFACFAAATSFGIALANVAFGDPAGPVTSVSNFANPWFGFLGAFFGGECFSLLERGFLTGLGLLGGIWGMVPVAARQTPQPSAPQPQPSAPQPQPSAPQPQPSAPQPQTSTPPTNPPRRPRRPSRGPRPMLFQHPGTAYHTILHP